MDRETGQPRPRTVPALAGLAAAAILALLTWAAGAGSSVSISLVVGVLGAYVVARGLMAAVMSIVKHRGDLAFRLAAEAVLIAFGALAFTTPDSFSHAAIGSGRWGWCSSGCS